MLRHQQPIGRQYVVGDVKLLFYIIETKHQQRRKRLANGLAAFLRQMGDGFPAYEIWIADEFGNTYLLFGRNPIESGEGPMSLFGTGEHQYQFSGNSKDLESKKSFTFEERQNIPESEESCD